MCRFFLLLLSLIFLFLLLIAISLKGFIASGTPTATSWTSSLIHFSVPNLISSGDFIPGIIFGEVL